MTKRRTRPTAAAPDPESLELDRATDEGMPEPANSEAPQFSTVEVLVPLAQPAEGFFPMEVEVELSREQRTTLQRIAAGIAAASKKHTGGRGPNGAASAVKYLIDLVAASDHAPAVHADPSEYQGG
jgi:hypothetical protein